MFSSPTPAPGSRAIASHALRSAGLIDRDAPMRDLTDRPGGRKASSKIRSRHKTTLVELDGSTPRVRIRSPEPESPFGLSIRRTGRGRARIPGAATNPLSILPRVKPKVRTIEAWKEVVQKRWNPETQFLNLESLIDDELVKKYNLTPPGSGGDARVAAAIFKVASQLTPKVRTLSLANNKLRGLHLQFLAHYLPSIENLSLQNNNIQDLKDLETLSARKGRLNRLRELILIGNPIQASGTGRNSEKYRKSVLKLFVTLEVLDQISIAQIAFDRPGPSSETPQVPISTTFPFDMAPSFVTGVDGSIVSNFLLRFLGALDTQRASLMNVYDPNATFSFSVNTTIAQRARVQGFHTSMPNQTKLTWGNWLDRGSRNISRQYGDYDRAFKTLHVGPDDIIKALVSLPGTKHDISGPAEKFSIDSFPVVHGQGMGLLLMVHGQFTEVGVEGIRSFDRSFILVPAVEGSPGKLNGWDVVIMSDQWTIRVYSSHEAWKPGPLLVQARPHEEQSASTSAAVNPTPPQQQVEPQPFNAQATLNSMPEQQRNLVMQVCQRTGLNVQFAIECLNVNGWDLDRAIANFEQVKVGRLAKEVSNIIEQFWPGNPI